MKCRGDLLEGKETPLTKATSFLHKEYDPVCFWWELAEMLRRFFLVGIFVVVQPGSKFVSAHTTPPPSSPRLTDPVVTTVLPRGRRDHANRCWHHRRERLPARAAAGEAIQELER
jgi:hypothetical protein